MPATYDLFCNAPGHAGRSAERGYSDEHVHRMTLPPTAEQIAAPHYCDACSAALLGKVLPDLPAAPPPDPEP